MQSFGRTLAITALATLTLSACNGSSDGTTSTGTASFNVTDAPVDNVDRVKVTFDAIAIKPQEGPIERVDFDEPVTR